MLNAAAGILGLVVQIATFALVYLMVAPTRGRSRALLYGAVVALSGYALVLLGLATCGIPWQVSNVLLAVVLAVAASNARVRARIARRPNALSGWVRGALPAAAILAVLLGVQVVAVVLLPELSIDGQLYHGPVLAQLLETGTLWGWNAPNQYMYYTDLTMLGGVNLASFTGRSVFDNGVQIPHLLLLVLALNVLLQRRFDRVWVRIAFAALIVTAPVVWLQPRILYVDVAYGAAVATMIVLIVTTRRVGAVDMLVAGVSAAAVLASKPTGILTSATLLVVWVVVAVWRRRSEWSEPKRTWGVAVWPVLLAAVVPMIMGLGFYFRNLISFGNPVYPVQASFGPLKLRGIIDLSVFASGERGSGLFDPTRLLGYGGSLATGMLHGVAKTDYDPRAGGYGYVTAAVIGIAVAIVIAQLLYAAVLRRRPLALSAWRTQLAVVALTAVIVTIQPSSFDSRYVIGPTAVLLAAVLMSSVFAAARLINVVAAVCALVIAAGQIVWTETHTYPGLRVAKELRGLASSAQPMTPGNPWGASRTMSWLPTDGCHSIAIQTNGGVAAWGMAEQSQLATLPYGLYGDDLCNLVEPVQLSALESGAAPGDPVPAAEYLILYTDDLNRWRALYPELAPCWNQVGEIASSEGFPQAVTVFSNSCR